MKVHDERDTAVPEPQAMHPSPSRIGRSIKTWPPAASRSAARRRDRQEARLSSIVLDQLPLAVAVFDIALRLHYWNLRAATLLGVPPMLAHETPPLAEVLAGALSLTPPQRNRLTTFCEAQVSAGVQADPDTVLRLSLSRSKRFLVQARGLGADQWMLVIDDRKAASINANDVTDAWLDALTGLSNRRHFNIALKDAIAEADSAAPHALLMVDLDRFKAVNDTLGHPIGDALLCLVAQRLRREVREADLLARFGADEFVILARGDSANLLAARIVDILCRPFLVEGNIVNIGVSVGVARFTGHDVSADDLMQHADLALHDAKNAGGRTWREFQPLMAAKAKERRILETDLRKALALGELSLAYQPQLDSRTGTITGFEALVRWKHPTRGMVPPAEFIPVAEEIGCIVGLGEWVMKTACLEAARWPAPLTVAVNVSPKQLDGGDRLFDMVMAALQASGLEPGRLEIEITESALLTHEGNVLKTLRRFREAGIGIAMDDFGTGYSSLSQLQKFPFSKIKIDRAFVAGLGTNPESATMVKAIVAMGSGLGMTTIAEGVETAEQAALAQADGCTNIQGYLISRPIAPSDIDGLLKQYAVTTEA